MGLNLNYNAVTVVGAIFVTTVIVATVVVVVSSGFSMVGVIVVVAFSNHILMISLSYIDRLCLMIVI